MMKHRDLMSEDGNQQRKGTNKMNTVKQAITRMMAAVALLAAGSAWSGDLTPPGAPAPTMHTLEELYQQLVTATQQVSTLQVSLANLQQRLNADGMAAVVGGMVLIPAGAFQMGDCFGEGDPDERPRHTVTVSAFYLDQYEVTKAQWDEVYSWAITNGYAFTYLGAGKGTSHPVHKVGWYDCVKWCNARSQKEGLTPVYRYVTWEGFPPRLRTYIYYTGERDDVIMYDNGVTPGYRLPTEAEWEKAARGGATGRRFPWSGDNTIQHARANYCSHSEVALYDTSPTWDYHPSYTNEPQPYTSPVGSFSPNGHGLYDMAGNVFEWCWDGYSSDYYSISPATDPQGSTTFTTRVARGGSWSNVAPYARVANRIAIAPDTDTSDIGFRCARGL